jgi:TolA-binding protein
MYLQSRVVAVFAALGIALAPCVAHADKKPEAADQTDVLVYPTRDDGSIMHWLAVSPLQYNAAYIGDSLSYDVFKRDGGDERTVRPRAGDLVQGRAWHPISSNGTTEGPTMVDLFQAAGGGFDYGITVCHVYLYSPVDRPKAVFSGSSDDGLKVIWNGAKVWSNQIQRSPTYDSDRAPAPIKKGWNTLLCVVDQVIGGHLLTARFLDDGKAVTDLEIALDPPRPDATRHPAEAYNRQAATLMRAADALKADGKLAEAVEAYGRALKEFPLADAAPRAAYAAAETLYSADGRKSLDQPEKAVAALETLLGRYRQDVLAEYGLLDLAKIQETALHDDDKAAATYLSFEEHYPHSPQGAKALVGLARLLARQKKYEDSILTYRKAMRKYPQSDEVMDATVGVADAYRLAGDADKARQQYEAARVMARDWHDNKYGVDVGKQAWLDGILDYLRVQLKDK